MSRVVLVGVMALALLTLLLMLGPLTATPHPSPAVALASPSAGSPTARASTSSTQQATAAKPTSTARPSSHATPTATPRATATPTPIVFPTPNPSYSPTPTPRPTPTPTPVTTATPTPTPAPTPAPVNAGSLAIRVSGNHLVTASGQTIQLRGVDISATEFACDQGSAAPYGWSIFGGPNNSASVVQAIASWNTSAVRVPLNEDCWLGINQVNPAYGGAAYRNAITNYVSLLHQYGLYVVLDLHWNAPSTFPAQSQQPMADADHSITFWSSVATTFKNDPAVIFDLYNEPFLYGNYLQNSSTDVWACWLNGCGVNQYLTGGTPYTKPYNWQTAGMQQLVNAVRATGARQPIMVGGLDWANNLSGWLTHQPQDPLQQLVASWHSYPGQPCSPQSCWDSVIAPLATHVPVVVGETGDNDCSAVSYVNSFLPWADAHGVSYLGWTFNPWSYCQNVLIKDWSGTPASNYGVYFQTHLRSFPPQNPYFH